MTAKIFRINYKSDFILTLNSDAGWMTPFCIKFWTGAPSQAYFVGWDGDTYTHCAYDPTEPTKLLVQFDDHHLPIGDLKFQIAYHFTVADFPTSVEDEVINQADVIIEQDGEPAQVMLDFNGETAPEIEFSLPAYANEAQRIANEQERIAAEEQRVSNEQQRISNEEDRISAEESRQEHEQQRIRNEETRIEEFAGLKADAIAATGAANDAATLANEKAALAQQKADYAQAKGDYAKAQGDTALADHERAESDHATAASDHTQASSDHDRAESDHSQAAQDHDRAESDHTRAESDHAAVEVYVDSLGAFDISSYHATGSVLAKYADLTTALGTNGANIPDVLRKGGMSVKFVQSSDNKYVQYRLTKDEWSANASDWIECDSNKVEGKVFYVTDGNGYVIAKIDKDGVHSVDFRIGGNGDSVAEALNGISGQISNAVNAEKLLREQGDAAITGLVEAEEARAKAAEDTKLNYTITDDKFCITDTNGYIICQIDASGVNSVDVKVKVDEELVSVKTLIDKKLDQTLDSSILEVTDSNGYIIAKIDANGVHSAKDKHAVACMVLSESYYPTAAPVRDGEGNVTYAEVMFESGIEGSISITYTNGNSSSVAVVYGNYNYTITINRDADGNVEKVLVN